MIRINLLETAEKKRRRKRQIPSGTPVIILYAVMLLLEGFLLYYWSGVKDQALAAQIQQTQDAQLKLDGFQKLKAERDELQTKMDEERTQADIFAGLHNATIGPGNMLMYLTYLLTVPPLENHGERVAQEQIGWNTQWDPDRAWFTTIKQSKDDKLLITGEAVSHHDTDEILRRIKSSVYFQGVHFVSAKVGKKAGEGQKSLIEFRIEAYLNYDLNVGKEPEVVEGEEKGKGKGGKDKGGKGKGGKKKG